jgi:hypothetical protein
MYIVLIYLAVLILAGYSLFARKPMNPKIEKIIFFAVMIIFLFRFNLGSDTKMYLQIFTDLSSDTLTIPEVVIYKNMRFPLFSLMMYAVAKLGGSFYTFSALLNFIFIPLVAYTTYKESKNLYLSLVVFVGSGILMVYYTSAMRQMICMAVFFFAYYKYLQHDHYAAYYLCTIPLIFIQEVSAVCLIIPLFYRFRSFFITKKGYAVLIVLGLVGILLTSTGNYLLPSHFASIFGEEDVSLMGIGLQCSLLVMIIVLYAFSSKDKLDDKDRFQVFLCVASFLLYMIFAKNQLASRVSDFIQIIYLVLLPKLLISIEQKRQKALAFAGTAAIMSVLLTSDLNDNLNSRFYNNSLLKYPYVTIFNMQDAKNYYAFSDLELEARRAQ